MALTEATTETARTPPVGDRPQFPERYLQERQSQFRWSAGCLVICTILAVSGVLLTCWSGVSAWLAALALALSVWGLAVSLLACHDTSRWVRLIPYFDRPVGDIDTFLAGEALAREFGTLERLAAERGIQPLSAFGFNDDLCGEPLVWHPADVGLKSVRALQEALAGGTGDLPDPVAVAADLELWRHALERARDNQIQFCVLLRVGNGTSAHEWEVRRGTAF